ncbi:unnamed protein product [Urochloa decumbens]|uniref:Uncharacterized protein n=1 Tax=Urochloa decumbens TaxID=240449 RepID=A0ABC9GHE3_9POAL
MNSWPLSDRVPLKAPGYVKMPGRPKTLRRREATEPRKPTKMSNVGTVIRCTKCRGTGHNISTCVKRNMQGTSAPGSSRSVGTPNVVTVVSNTQQILTSTKRKATTSLQISEMSGTSNKKANNKKQNITTSAKAKVATGVGGYADLKLHAHVPLCQASSSVKINIKSGTATAQVSAHEPGSSKKTAPKRPYNAPLMLLPPWQSDKL